LTLTGGDESVRAVMSGLLRERSKLLRAKLFIGLLLISLFVVLQQPGSAVVCVSFLAFALALSVGHSAVYFAAARACRTNASLSQLTEAGATLVGALWPLLTALVGMLPLYSMQPNAHDTVAVILGAIIGLVIFLYAAIGGAVELLTRAKKSLTEAFPYSE